MYHDHVDWKAVAYNLWYCVTMGKKMGIDVDAVLSEYKELFDEDLDEYIPDPSYD